MYVELYSPSCPSPAQGKESPALLAPKGASEAPTAPHWQQYKGTLCILAIPMLLQVGVGFLSLLFSTMG